MKAFLFSLFSSKGRINRSRFFLNWLVLLLFLILGWAIITVILTLFTVISTLLTASLPSSLINWNDFYSPAFIGWFILLVALQVTNMIKRLHDLGLTDLWAILFFIPYINIVFFLYLLFATGIKGSNKYGDDPLAKSI